MQSIYHLIHSVDFIQTYTRGTDKPADKSAHTHTQTHTHNINKTLSLSLTHTHTPTTTPHHHTATPTPTHTTYPKQTLTDTQPHTTPNSPSQTHPLIMNKDGLV